jgi:hypothetical protein
MMDASLVAKPAHLRHKAEGVDLLQANQINNITERCLVLKTLLHQSSDIFNHVCQILMR